MGVPCVWNMYMHVACVQQVMCIYGICIYIVYCMCDCVCMRYIYVYVYIIVVCVVYIWVVGACMCVCASVLCVCMKALYEWYICMHVVCVCQYLCSVRICVVCMYVGMYKMRMFMDSHICLLFVPTCLLELCMCML